MIRSHRRIEAPALRAFLRHHAVVHPRYRVHAVDNARVVSEDDLLLRGFVRKGMVGRPVATVLLAGRARISADGRSEWIDPGVLLLMHSKSAISMRQEGESYQSLVFEWDVGPLGARPEPFTTRPLDGDEVAQVRSLWDDVATRGADPSTIARLVGLLQRAGAPLTDLPAEAYAEVVPPQTTELATALDVVLSNMENQPMTRDLEEVMGLSERQVNRLVSAYNTRYGFNSGGWRDTRNRRRLMMGVTLMTVASAKVDYVAHVVGYRSASAFKRALRDAHLPSPHEIPELVAALSRT